MEQKLKILNDHCAEMVHDEGVKIDDRADVLIYHITEHGLDCRAVVRTLLAEADLGRKLQKAAEEVDQTPLADELFVDTIEEPRFLAVVTRGRDLAYLPATREAVDGLKQGDPVLIDMKAGRLAGRDGKVAAVGDVATVESLPPDRPCQIVVKHQEHSLLARLHHRLHTQREQFKPGTRVLYDAQRRFVLDLLDTDTDGSELLTDLAKLGAVRRSDVGAPKPIAGEIVDRVRQCFEHPDWVKTMHARQRCSYLLVGGTGCGKSFHLKLVAQEVHDLVEEITGERTSRFVVCDASHFWHSLFGETEQRIALWADRLRNLGARPLKDRQGRTVPFPLLVVLEECEALLRGRGEQQGSGHLFDRPLSLLLQKTESLEAVLEVPIIWVATSNRIDLADPAAIRRLGLRRTVFGTLSLPEAAAVLSTKLPADLPIFQENGDRGAARNAVIQRVLGYLYGPNPKQGLVEVQLANSERRTLNRCEMVTPAVIEEAISSATDECLRKSHRAGSLLGLDADAVIGFLHRHYTGMAQTLRPHNIAEHCPEWFADEAPVVHNVVPLVRRNRRTAMPLALG
ncbi:MAG: AAA family ATPase [Rhodopirellula sp.]|nr:AAA family ATPase [Rhodopirellula sp.]